MKKITESQLKDKVNSLREYLKVYELNEEGRGGDDFQPAYTAPKAAAPAAGAPADNRNFLQKGFDSVANFHKQNTERFNAKQAADAAANSPAGLAAARAKLTPSQLAWLGSGQPSPEILQRMPAPRPGETAPAAAPAPSGYGLKPPQRGVPLDGSDDRRVGGQGLKLPPQTPVTSVAAAQAALGAEDNPEAAMGAGQYPRVGPNTKIAPNSDAANAERDGAPVAPAKTNPYDMFKKADGSPAAPPGFKPPPPGVIWSEPDAGQHATKVARFKELIAKAKELRTDKEVQASKDLGSFAGESTTYFLNKLRLIESRQLNEALTPEEQAEMDELSTELGQEGVENDPELMTAFNDYNSIPTTAAQAAVPYTGPSRAQQADMDASSQGATPASDLAKANAQDQQADMDASSQPPPPKYNAAKDSQKSNVTALSTEVRAISDALGKLDPANTTQAELQPLFDRIKKVQADASGAGADVNAIVQPLVANAQDGLKQAMAAVNKASAGAVVDPNAAKNPYAGVKWAYVPGDGTVAGSAKMAADAAAAAKNTSASTGVGNPGEEAAAQAAADKAAQANQAAAVRPPVAVDPRDGAVGQSLAKMGVSKQDRLDQKFVDSTLGAGKYKAGSAESNMALQAHFKKQAGGSGAPVAPATSSALPITSVAPGEKIIPTAPKLNATGGAKAVAGLNKEPIKFPGNDQAAKTVTQKKNSKSPAIAPSAQSTATPDGNVQDFTYESVGYNELQRIMSLVNHR